MYTRSIFTKISVLLILFITTISSASAQSAGAYTLKGKFVSKSIVDELTVHLAQAADNKLVKMEFVDDKGNFVFEGIPEGNYRLITQSLFYKKYESPVIALTKDQDLGSITLEALDNVLKEVSVTAVKPFVQQRYDKTVLNVANSINAVGSTALEVLEKAPGITVDQNDNIAMRGRQGVLVMIDGKFVPMSGQDLANMLRSMSSDQIEKIDLITNPSAKYDASGNSGIIDIRLKKGKNDGFNGNIALTYGQGRYEKINPSVTLNSRKGKLNLFGSYSYNHRKDFNDLTIYRSFYENEAITASNNYDNYFKFGFNNHNVRLGADYNLSKSITLGISGNGLFTDGNITSDSRAQSLDGLGQNSGSFVTNGLNKPNRNNGSVNVNYRQVLDTAGQELTADFDYARYGSGEIQNYTTHYFDNSLNESRPAYSLFGDLNGDLDIRSFKIDYVRPLGKTGVKLEAGLKSSWVETDNDVQFYDRSNGGNVLDEGKSNRFIYDENINAGYLNGSKSWKKLSLQIGLRLENTIANGRQVTNNDDFKRDYTQFFPSGYVGYKFSDNNDLGISLSRRINRPSYRQLNPFKVFLDPLTYSAGNPYLNPEITNSFELTHTFKQKYMTKIGYSRTTDNIISVLSPDETPNSVIQTGRNLARYDYYNLSFGFPLKIGKWLNSTNNALLYYGEYTGNLVNTELNAGRVAFNFNTNNSILVNPNTSLELNGNYQSRAYYGFLDMKAIWSLNFGIQRQIWEKRASVKLNVSDVFFSNQANAFTQLTGYREKFVQNRDSRVATFSFSYKFGNGQANSPRRKTGGAEEEKQRAGS